MQACQLRGQSLAKGAANKLVGIDEWKDVYEDEQDQLEDWGCDLEEDEAFERVGRTAGATQRSAEARPSAGRQTFPFTLRSEGARESPSELLCKESILKLKDLEPPTGICALLSVFTTLRGAPLTPADTNITPSTVPASNRSFGSVHATSH